ncbi:MAG TPA: ATP-binding protein, partial [Polyangiaceae bacterium]
RQSGKTTLCRMLFPRKPYVSLEAPDVRARVLEDPRGFLADHPDGAVLDEVQRAPELLSYLQVDVDERRRPGRWILTGSQNFALAQGLSQSLAGRSGILTLLPLSAAELGAERLESQELLGTLLRGGYPAIHQHRIPPAEWMAAYVATYVERDVRQLLAVGDLSVFQTFLGLAAGRAGQIVNLSALGSDAGVSHNTARSWLGCLEASYVAERLPPWHGSLTSRLVKSPKLHFLDSGLHCFLLGIRTVDELRNHPLRGAIFEGWVVSEIRKTRQNRGLSPDLHFFRDAKGLEADLLVGRGVERIAVEIKSGQTLDRAASESLDRVAGLLLQATPPIHLEQVLVYGGEGKQRRKTSTVLGWRDVARHNWGSV